MIERRWIHAVPCSSSAALALLAALVLVAVSAPDARSQDVPAAVTRAEELADAGRFSEAADALLVWADAHPDDAGVRWRAAQLLARAGRTGEAVQQYEAALALTPDDPWLRLEYADAVAADGRFGDAADVLRPLPDAPEAPAEARLRAREMLGTLAYWRGDLSDAVRRFEAVLDDHPDRSEAARQLREIRVLTRPWIGLTLEGFEDDQPYYRGHATVAGGFFVTPLWSVELEATPRALEPAAGGAGSGDVRSATGAAGSLRGFVPAARLEVDVGAGAELRSGASDWSGHAALGVRLPGDVTVRARAQRSRYLWTVESVDTLLMVEAAELVVDRADHPGWAGEAALRREAYPGGNTVRTVYAWILAPVAPVLRLGAAASWQDADETRWSPTAERYAPYFTPEEQREVSALAELKVPLGAATGRVNGTVGLHAEERAPVASAGATGVDFTERSYTPWRVVGSVDVPAGERLSLHVEGERRETAFYGLTRVSLGLMFRPGGP